MFLSPNSASSVGILKSSQSRKSSTVRRVGFFTSTTEVIGSDGGLENLGLEPEEYFEDIEETSNITLILSDEDKKFSILAAGNTVWNGDNKNLQVSTSHYSYQTGSEIVFKNYMQFKIIIVKS